jgi:UDP-N-acetylglucosamine--N-acetylmuramyl-(pentapeptide) pyrophosphoryl-undecaprenol N-acetylglucosamine transferase
MMHPVVIAAGGTGGHVIPALAVANELRQRDIPVVWLGTHAGLEARLVPAAGIDIRWISVAGLRGKTVLQTLTGPFKLMLSCLQSLQIVYSLKPRAVLGMGGFVSGPVGIAALILRKPLVLHEQNAVAGMTNRHLSGLARRVLVRLVVMLMNRLWGIR